MVAVKVDFPLIRTWLFPVIPVVVEFVSAYVKSEKVGAAVLFTVMAQVVLFVPMLVDPEKVSQFTVKVALIAFGIVASMSFCMLVMSYVVLAPTFWVVAMVVFPTLRVIVCVNVEEARFVVTVKLPEFAGIEILDVDSVGFDFLAIVVRLVHGVVTPPDAGIHPELYFLVQTAYV